MNAKLRLAAALLATAIAVSCNSDHNTKASNPAAAFASLVGTEWVLKDIAGTPALAKPQATLAFPQAGRAAGNASCNRFTGGVEITGNAVKFGALASTRMACMDGAVSEQEDRYLKTLQVATRYSLENGDLLIYCEGHEKPLRFSPAPAAKP